MTNVTPINGQTMTPEAMIAQMAEMAAKLEALTAQNARLKAQGQRKLTLKVSDKGAVSLYGMGRFPVTLYREQWERLLGAAAEIREFITDHADELSVKG